MQKLISMARQFLQHPRFVPRRFPFALFLHSASRSACDTCAFLLHAPISSSAHVCVCTRRQHALGLARLMQPTNRTQGPAPRPRRPTNQVHSSQKSLSHVMCVCTFSSRCFSPSNRSRKFPVCPAAFKGKSTGRPVSFPMSEHFSLSRSSGTM